ncbi:unnamed protein product [Rhodiola kirilowii]
MSGRNSYGKRSYSQSDYENSGSKKRNSGEDRDSFSIGSEDTVYRYICPVRKIGSIIGRGGDIVKQLRNDTKAKIRIGDTVPGCDDRVVTIYSPSDETNPYEDGGNYISPAQDALFRVHDRVSDDDLHGDDESEGSRQVTARLLVPSDQIGCVIGKGGQIVQNIRTETGAQIRIMKDDHLPRCALSTDELVQISGDASLVKKAFYQIASRLHDNPSRSQHLLASASSTYPSASSFVAPSAGAPLMGLNSLVGPYGGYRSDAGDWSRSYYPVPRDDISSKEFSLRLVCRTANIGSVIGKGGAIINQIRQESGAGIKVDSSVEEDTLITISAKEYFEDISPATEAALRLQPRCSDKSERDSGIVSFTTRMFVPSSRIGCLIGKGGNIITEIRKLTRANIRILPKENLPKIALEDDEMVQISGDLDVARDALIQIITRLRANLFDREGAVSTFLPVLPYIPGPPDNSDGSRYDSRDRDRDRDRDGDSKRHRRSGQYYPEPYGSSADLPTADRYGSYGSPPQISGARGSAYGAYGSSYTSGGRSDSSSYVDRVSTQAPASRRRGYN